ncbi:acidic repeat-containing protein-like [Ischnura elegans]|uniref:acidic repeat-containing protein-like n=1 Tax=Ischnura elegans TaxID=197161 RepID=UPI001ED88A00|nr:acidic repeat-containing protein-like [Ischnura elegans]
MQLIFIIVLVVNLSGALQDHPQANIHRKARTFFHGRTRKTLPVNWDPDDAKGLECDSLNGASCDAKDFGGGSRPAPTAPPPKAPPQACPEAGEFPQKNKDDCEPRTPMKEAPKELICPSEDGCEGPEGKSDIKEQKSDCDPDGSSCEDEDEDDEGDDDEGDDEGDDDEDCKDAPNGSDTGASPPWKSDGPPGRPHAGPPGEKPHRGPPRSGNENCGPEPEQTDAKIAIDTKHESPKIKAECITKEEKDKGSQQKCGPQKNAKRSKKSMLVQLKDDSGGSQLNRGVRMAPVDAGFRSGPLRKRAGKKLSVQSEIIRLKNIGVSGPVGAWVGRRRRSQSEPMTLTKNYWTEPYEPFQM